MVLESILTPQECEKQPLDMLVLGFGVATIGLWFAYFIFPGSASSWFLFLTVVALVPLIHRILNIEEGKEEKLTKESLWQRHEEVVFIYLFLFFGMIVAFSFWYTILPESMVQVMFKDQIAEILRVQNLKTSLTGQMIAPAATLTGFVVLSKLKVFKLILFNNLRLLFLFGIFSFMFGAGALLLLTWNSAIVGVAIGNLIKEGITAATTMGGRTAIYFKALPFSFMAFFVHGIFEIMGYFFSAIAGGILSVAIIRSHHRTPYLNRVLKDVALLFLFAVLLIVIGAVVEVYITPVL